MQQGSFDNQDSTAVLVREFIKERRSERRWKNMRFFIGLALFILVIGLIYSEAEAPLVLEEGETGYVSLIRLDGMIGPGQGFSAESVLPLLKKAFSDKQAKGVVLDI